MFRPVARAEKDYATHIPILVSIAQATKVEKVLELGCGEYSTLTFLNSEVFPSLTMLDSFDTDEGWLNRISSAVNDDRRLRQRLILGGMSKAIQTANLEDYDLILVDDSASSEARSATIHEISNRAPKRAIVVIHDYEVRAYRRAAAAFQHQFVFKSFNPQTGVVWNGKKTLATILKRYEVFLRRNVRNLAPDDVTGWKKALVPLV